MALLTPRTFNAVDGDALAALRDGLAALSAADARPQLVAGDAVLELPEPARAAVADLLQRFADGKAVLVGTEEDLLTTSQTAKMLGISSTYVIQLSDAGTIPVRYRGTHRRFAVSDLVRYLRERAEPASTDAEHADKAELAE
jgi:excisionase family DNA binding protein